MPPDSVRMLDAAFGGEAGEVEQPRNALLNHGVGHPKVAAVDSQILDHREVGIEIVHLRHDADADARLARADWAPVRRPA